MLLRHLIALTIDAHPKPRSEDHDPKRNTDPESLDQLASWFALRRPGQEAQPFGPFGAACNSPDGRTNQRFTMSDNTRKASPLHGSGQTTRESPRDPLERNRPTRRLVEPDGIEPTTSCLQSTRSPS